MSGSAAVGIDLGTTYTCVAVLRQNKIEIIPNMDDGHHTMPSCVAFTNIDRLVGQTAADQITGNPSNTVFDVKRIMGLPYDDPALKADMKRWPFKVNNYDGVSKIEVQYKGKREVFCPEQISAMILSKAKESAEAFLGQIVDKAVVTVPAYFNDSQRRATRDACTIAGLKVLHMINEPTAAAIAYGFERKIVDKRNILIFDLGGGTFDVTVLTAGAGTVEIHSTAGNTHLGGQDFNNKILRYILAEIKMKNKMDLTDNKRALSRLWVAIERAKKVLSHGNQTNISLDALYDGTDFQITINRALFNDKNAELFVETLSTVDEALKYARIDRQKIDEVLLVGGSTRIPQIQKILDEYFGKNKICKTINPDEAVAHGAAVQAAIKSGNAPDELTNLDLHDVTPLSLGVECKGQLMEKVVPRNTKIPLNHAISKSFTTTKDDQEVIDFLIFEGERADTAHNHRLGKFRLNGITRATAGEPIIKVEFKIDDDGVVDVSAQDTTSGKTNNIVISQDRSRLSKKEIQIMIKLAEQYREEDEMFRKKTAALNELDELANSVKRELKKITVKQSTLSKFEEIRNRIEENRGAECGEIEKIQKELEELCEELELKCKFHYTTDL